MRLVFRCLSSTSPAATVSDSIGSGVATRLLWPSWGFFAGIQTTIFSGTCTLRQWGCHTALVAQSGTCTLRLACVVDDGLCRSDRPASRGSLLWPALMKIMEPHFEAVRAALQIARDARVHPADIQRLVLRWTTPVKALATAVEIRAEGTLCTTRTGICLLPGVDLPCGERVSVDMLPAPPGLSWAFWAEAHERAQEGWSLGRDSKPRRPAEPTEPSRPLENERPRTERSRRSDRRAPPGSGT